MADDSPKLRLVDPDERAQPTPESEPDHDEGSETDSEPVAGETGSSRRTYTWISAAIPLCIGIAILSVGFAMSLKLLMNPKRAEPSDNSRTVVAGAPDSTTSSIDPLSLLPRASTSVGETTAAPATAPPTTAAPVPTTVSGGLERFANPSLIPVPLAGAAPAAVPKPTTGAALIRIFNGFLPGTPLEVWEVSGPEPVNYGTVPFAELRQMAVGGQLLPSGVGLQLRFVRPGGDPTGSITEGESSKTGPWGWNFTPQDGSSHTVMLAANPGLSVVRIDNLRALGAVAPGKVHVVPVVRHLVLEGTRTKRWAADGVGCLGPVTTDKKEFDVPVGTAVRLASADDATCEHTITDADVLSEATAVAVVGVEQPGDRARLITVPLG